jgi:hypothetical protein
MKDRLENHVSDTFRFDVAKLFLVLFVEGRRAVVLRQRENLVD